MNADGDNIERVDGIFQKPDGRCSSISDSSLPAGKLDGLRYAVGQSQVLKHIAGSFWPERDGKFRLGPISMHLWVIVN